MPGNTAALKNISALSYKGIKLRLLRRRYLKVYISHYRAAQAFIAYFGAVTGNDTLLRQLFNTGRSGRGGQIHRLRQLL